MHQNGWVIMENHVEMDDLMIWGTTHIRRKAPYAKLHTPLLSKKN
jgi:hypothetical protein